VVPQNEGWDELASIEGRDQAARAKGREESDKSLVEMGRPSAKVQMDRLGPKVGTGSNSIKLAWTEIQLIMSRQNSSAQNLIESILTKI